jgi:hypothetical protein
MPIHDHSTPFHFCLHSDLENFSTIALACLTIYNPSEHPRPKNIDVDKILHWLPIELHGSEIELLAKLRLL